jgi:hypothetical protein
MRQKYLQSKASQIDILSPPVEQEASDNAIDKI